MNTDAQNTVWQSLVHSYRLTVTQNEPMRMECTCAQNTIGHLTII